MAKNTDISTKTGATGVGGAVATIALYVLSSAGIDFGSAANSAAVGAGIATVVASLLSWLARDKMRDIGTGNVAQAVAGVLEDVASDMGPGTEPVPASDLDDESADDLEDDPDDGTASETPEDGDQS